MLDIHPLRFAPNGWRDFLVHIATIVIGLLIAISANSRSSGCTATINQ